MIEVKEWLTPIVVGAYPNETVEKVVKRMKQYGIGSVIVNSIDQRPVGILTERDILNKVVAEKKDPEKTLVSDVMTAPVETVNVNQPVLEVFKLFAAREFRHLPVTLDDGRIIGVLSLRSKNFIHEIIRIMGVLQSVNELKSHFLANVSHDLKTPLISITKSANILRTEMPQMKPEEVNNFLEVIERQGERLLKLISDLLDITALEAGKMRLQKRNINLLGLVDTAVKNTEVLARRKNIAITYETHTEDPVVFVDEFRIIQVLINLISNALKFTNEGGKIRIDIHKEDINKKSLRVAVSDTGIGIPKEKLRVIFERFEQAHDPHMGIKQEGTGLGLTIVKEIVGLHSGKVWVESEENKGSTFYFTLPAEAADVVVNTMDTNGKKP